MKSTASVKGHPLHPIMVSFPIAFFTGAFFCDCISYFMGKPNLWNTGKLLSVAGIAFGLLAAVPGIIDFIFTVPPDSSAKSRGAKHGILNSLVILLFIIAFILRHGAFSPLLVIGVEGLGFVLLFFAGYMGGTLVYRNQIAVYNRFADGGEWQETTASGSNGKYDAGHASELKLNQMKLIHAAGKRIIVARNERGIVAFDDKCPHKGGSLMGGVMICSTVQCPWHGSQFNVETGKAVAGPATEKIATYRVNEEGGRIFVFLK